MRTRIIALGALVLVTGVALNCKKKPKPAPELTMNFKSTVEGMPLADVAVTARGQGVGETDASGALTFRLTGEPGEEIVLAATLDRPGLKLKPWQDTLVVRKWDETKPETLKYDIEAKFEPLELAAMILVQSGSEPVSGAMVRIDGKPAGRSDESGQLTVPLGTRFERDVKLAISLKEHHPWEQAATLRAGETFTATLAKIGVIYGRILTAYEAMGRVIPVPSVELTLGGKSIGRTDSKGTLKYETPRATAQLTAQKPGYVAAGKVEVPRRRAAQLVVHIFPQDTPTHRLFVAPVTSDTPGDSQIESALPEIRERLSDNLFSRGCFEKAATASDADAVVSVAAARGEELLLTVKVVAHNGRQIGAFAETASFRRIRNACETIASKISDVFPFEGYVLGTEGRRIITNLGTSGERGLKKGQTMALYRWNGQIPPKLAQLGNASVRRAERASSQAQLASGAQSAAVGDKVVLLPREVEASFDAKVLLTVQAGKEGAEMPFADVNVYRNGTWIGVTSASGEIKVPVRSGEKYKFLFVRGGVKPYEEEIEITQPMELRTVTVPAAMCHLAIESVPSSARVFVDDREVGRSPVEVDVLMGFRHVKVDAGGDWRAFDEVLELTKVEESYTGANRIVLRKDVLKLADAQIAKGDIDGAIGTLDSAEREHPDYSAIHHRLASLYLDQKKDPQKAITEFEKVLALPENRELVNKRFAVTFLNLGRAYYLIGTTDGYEKAIKYLQTARANKRFFPKEQHDRATHDTLYFLALATHKLFYESQDDRMLRSTLARWKDYFDFFPASLKDDPEIIEARTGAEHYQEEIRRKIAE
jgi:tetratricopeptide (TPR) repeat protein